MCLVPVDSVRIFGLSLAFLRLPVGRMGGYHVSCTSGLCRKTHRLGTHAHACTEDSRACGSTVQCCGRGRLGGFCTAVQVGLRVGWLPVSGTGTGSHGPKRHLSSATKPWLSFTLCPPLNVQGPMVHIGACVASAISYVDCSECCVSAPRSALLAWCHCRMSAEGQCLSPEFCIFALHEVPLKCEKDCQYQSYWRKHCYRCYLKCLVTWPGACL